jgi:hypothetical protein
MVEAVIVMLVFLLFVFAIIESAFAMLQYSRVVEATRAGARYAVVNAPVCNLFDEDGLAVPACPTAYVCDAVTTTTLTVSCGISTEADCGNLLLETGMLGAMKRMLPTMTSANVNVTYACSGAGSDENPEPIPTVTVSTQGLTHPLILPEVFGQEAGFTLNIPAYSTTKLGEDLHTVP